MFVLLVNLKKKRLPYLLPHDFIANLYVIDFFCEKKKEKKKCIFAVCSGFSFPNNGEVNSYKALNNIVKPGTTPNEN